MAATPASDRRGSTKTLRLCRGVTRIGADLVVALILVIGSID